MTRESIKTLSEKVMLGYDYNPWWGTDRDEITGKTYGELARESGNIVPGALTAQQVKSKLLDWDIVETKIYDADMTEIDGYKRLVASDDKSLTLGIHADSWAVHPYVDLCDISTLPIAASGLLRDRKWFWVQFAKDVWTHTVVGMDIRPFIITTTSTDGSLSTQINDGVTVAQCDNTMQAARYEGEKVHIRHTNNSAQDTGSGQRWLKDAEMAVRKLANVEADMILELDELAAQEITDQQFDQFVDLWQPLPEKAVTKGGGPGNAWTIADRKRDFIHELYDSDARCAPWRGSALGVVQTVNTYAHHHQVVRGGSQLDRQFQRTVKGEWGKVDSDTMALLDKALVMTS